MSREYIEVESLEDFMRVAEKVEVILRLDPFIIINYYGTIFYLNLSNLSPENVRKILTWLKGKLINIKSIDSYKSLRDFYEKNIGR